ncbi:MAG: hypothetical protein ABIR62_06135 [Dokdonella sp.]|uniref:hypothetical protein n=1 Tax=Dokdonella sp. TaxID=2291710 RepID=UPI0032652CE5
MRRNLFALPTVLVAIVSLSGCGFVHKHFGRDDTAYRKSAQDRPLEIPPDLDTPSSSGALTIPQAGTPSSASSSASVASPSTTSSSPDTQPPAASIASGAPIGGDGFSIADSVDSAWTRVGLAIERSGTATLLERDQPAHAFTVETTGQTTQKAGWFKRAITLGHATRKVAAKVRLVVRVSIDGSGSKVAVEGPADAASQDAARSLLAALRQRLS